MRGRTGDFLASGVETSILQAPHIPHLLFHPMKKAIQHVEAENRVLEILIEENCQQFEISK